MKIIDREKKATDINGVKIQTLSSVCAIVGMLILLFVGCNLHRIVRNYKELVNEFELHLANHDHIADLQNGSDEMTEQSRLFVVTQDPECMRKYFEVVDKNIRENRIFKINQDNKEKMSFELEHDTLTNAYSRLAFEEQKEELSREDLPIALLMMDVDRFKTINDRYGHDAGDLALKKVVATLQQLLRSEDIVARIGGDEFVVILKNVYSYSESVIGDKILKANEILQNPAEGEPKLSLSVGMAFSEKGYSEELLKKADQALYHTKTTGRCGYSIYKEEYGI